MPWPELGDIRRRCRELLNEHVSTYLTDNQLNALINDGEFSTAVISLGIEKELDISVSSGTRMYDFPHLRVLGIKRVPVTGRSRSVLRITPQQLGRNVMNPSELEYYFEWGKQIGFDPLPAASFAARVYYADYPTEVMIADTDTPSLPAALVPYIIDYVLAMAAVKDRRLGTGNFLFSKYVANLMSVRRSILSKYGAKLQDMRSPTSYQVAQQ